MNSCIGEPAARLAFGDVRVVDLTQTLSPEFPALQLPPQFGGRVPHRKRSSG